MDFIELLQTKCKISLNKQQQEAVRHKEGPAVILAVPGAGKTTTLMCRTLNLIMNHHIDPSRILSITFSNASAADMKARFKGLFGSLCTLEPGFSTIHSFAYRLVRYYYGLRRLEVPTLIEDGRLETSKLLALKQLYQQVNREQVNDDKLEELSNTISYIKNMMLSPDDGFEGMKIDIPGFADIYSQYEEYKRSGNYIDYDDMLVYCHKILAGSPEVLKMYRDRYLYVQVDEGQDTSKIQNAIIRLLVNPINNLFLVADDDQSIYRWRGADPKALLEFEKFYPGARVFFMEHNYRSTKKIIAAASCFIKVNKERYSKNMFTENSDGEQICITGLEDEYRQYEYLVKELKSKKDIADMAIIFRNNISTIALADILSRSGISFYMKDNRPHFFKHWLTCDITAFFRLAMDNENIEAFTRVYYKMNLYISKSMLEYVQQEYYRKKASVFNILLRYPGINEKQFKLIDRAKKTFKTIAASKPEAAIEHLEKGLKYTEYLKSSVEKMGYSLEYLNSLLSIHKILAGSTKSLEDFIKSLDRLQEVMDLAKNNRGRNAVTLSTIHSCKGLEFENVYMIDMIDKQFPGIESIDEAKKGNLQLMEEERRLCYVGMTRAKRHLDIITTGTKNGTRVQRSRFVDEIEKIINPGLKKKKEKPLIEDNPFDEGMVVIHRKFGEGVVHEIDGNMITIGFKKYGVKKFQLDFCIESGMLKEA